MRLSDKRHEAADNNQCVTPGHGSTRTRHNKWAEEAIYISYRDRGTTLIISQARKLIELWRTLCFVFFSLLILVLPSPVRRYSHHCKRWGSCQNNWNNLLRSSFLIISLFFSFYFILQRRIIITLYCIRLDVLFDSLLCLVL